MKHRFPGRGAAPLGGAPQSRDRTTHGVRNGPGSAAHRFASATRCAASGEQEEPEEAKMTPPPVIRLHPDDGVLIARSSLMPGVEVAKGVVTTERIPAGHKVAIRAIPTGEPVKRYGQIIGFATQPIAPGQHVHTQNCGMGDFAKDYAFGVDVKPTPNFDLPASFDGIVRPDGRVATRNYIGILTSVNCSAH